MQRIALVVGAFALLTLSGCQTQQARRVPPAQQPPGPRVTHQRPVRVIPPRTWYPPLEPLPPMPRPPQPAPPPAKLTPAPSSPIGTLVTAAQIRPAGPLQKNRWKVIVVHHSADEDATPNGMDRYHRVNRGWKHGLGYHFVIGGGENFPDGKIFVGNRWKQQLEGAHCASKAGRFFGVNRPAKFFNNNGIGICLIGNMETQRPTPRQLAALEQLTVLLCKQTGISPSNVYGHGEVTHRTQCPGKLTNMGGLRSEIVARYRQAAAYAAQSEPERLDDLPVFEEEALAVALYGPEGADLALAATIAHELEDADALDGCLTATEPLEAMAMRDEGEMPAMLCAWPDADAIEEMQPVSGQATTVAGEMVGSARVRVITNTSTPAPHAATGNGARVLVRPAPPGIRPPAPVVPQRGPGPNRAQPVGRQQVPAYLNNRGGQASGVMSASASAKVHVAVPPVGRPAPQPVHTIHSPPQLTSHAAPRAQTSWPQPVWVQQSVRPQAEMSSASRTYAPVSSSSAAPVVVRPAPAAPARSTPPAATSSQSGEILDGCWNGKCGLETTRRKRKDHWIPAPATQMSPVGGGSRKSGKSLFGW